MTNNKYNDEIKHLLELLKTDVINSMQAHGKVATGQTARQIMIVENAGNLQLQLPGYILALEAGRQPTNRNAVAGNPLMIQRIKQWCQEKGIPDKAVWAIKKSIDKKGYPGKPGVLTEPLGGGNINLRLGPVLNDIASIVCNELVGQIK